MIKRFTLIGTFTLVLVAVALPGYAQTHVSIGIGAPVAVVPAAPYPGYVWRPAPNVVHRRVYVAPPVVAAPDQPP